MKNLILSVLAIAMSIGFVGTTYAAKTEKGTKGVFVKVAEDKKSITVTTGGKKNPQDVVIMIDDSTKVTVDGAAATLADLKAGQKVTISPSTGTAATIEATAAKKAK